MLQGFVKTVEVVSMFSFYGSQMELRHKTILVKCSVYNIKLSDIVITRNFKSFEIFFINKFQLPIKGIKGGGSTLLE